MRLLFALNADTEGLIVGELFSVGEFTVQGTVLIVFQGVVLGALGGLVYGLVRPALPAPPLLSGVCFGVWLVAAFLGLLVAGEDRDFQLFGPLPLALALFGVVFVAYGDGLGRVLERDPTVPFIRSGQVRIVTTRVLLGLSGLAGVYVLAQEIAART